MSELPHLPAAEGRRFGWTPPAWRPSEGARRDAPFAGEHTLAPLPNTVDLRPHCPPVYDQAAYNACTANAVAAMVHYFRIKQALSNTAPSRMFIYWFTRVGLGDQQHDSGGSIAAAIQAALHSGYCFEHSWPYTNATLFAQPPPDIVSDGRSHQIVAPVALDGLGGIKRALARGQPVAFGLWLYNSFFDADLNHGLVPMPDTSGANEKHAGLLVGYDDATQRLFMRNSWGLSTPSGRPCGDQGYYYLPYDYVMPNLATDFWTISAVVDSPGT